MITHRIQLKISSFGLPFSHMCAQSLVASSSSADLTQYVLHSTSMKLQSGKSSSKLLLTVTPEENYQLVIANQNRNYVTANEKNHAT